MIARMPAEVAAPLREELARIDAEMAAKKQAATKAKRSTRKAKKAPPIEQPLPIQPPPITVLEDKKQLETLLDPWQEKAKIYKAVKAESLSTQAVEKLTQRRLSIFEGTDDQISVYGLPLTSDQKRAFAGGYTSKENALTILDNTIAKHEAAIAKAQRVIAASGIDPSKLPETISDNVAIVDALTSEIADKKTKYLGVVAEGRMQSLLSYKVKKDSVYIEYLATSPLNLDPTDPARFKGGGTQAILAAIRKSQELGKAGAVSLDALPGAEGFYKSLGFKTKNYIMKLDSTAAEELLKKYG